MGNWMTPIVKAFGKQIAKLKKNNTWIANKKLLAQELNVDEEKLFRSLKGNFNSDVPNGTTLQGIVDKRPILTF